MIHQPKHTNTTALITPAMRTKILLFVKDHLKATVEIIISFTCYIISTLAILNMLDIPLTKSELTSQSVEQQLSLLTTITFVLTVYTLILGFASFTRVTINSRPKCYIQETRKTEIDNMLFVKLAITPGTNESRICSLHVKGCLISKDRVNFEERITLHHLYISPRPTSGYCTYISFYLKVHEKHQSEPLDCIVFGPRMFLNIFLPLSCKIIPPNLREIDNNLVSH